MSIYDKLGAKTAGVKARAIDKSAEKSTKSAPMQMFNASERMHAAEAKAEELEAKLKAAEAKSPNLEIPLDRLIEIEGRRRKLSDEEYLELVSNLRNNDLVTPITVRLVDGEKFEIISGHNRVAAFRQLGRETIPGIVRVSDAAQAELQAFYANLLQPALPDYEKYLGFQMIKLRQPKMSQEDIADMAGVSRSQVAKLMAYGDLPAEAHNILRDNVSAIGANAARDLSALTKEGKGESVITAIAMVAAGELDQSMAVKFATSKPRAIASTAEVVKFKSGRTTFCEYRRIDKTIRLSFKSAEEAAEIESAIQKILEERATARSEK